MDMDGSNAHAITNNGSINILPAWEPLWTRIYFTSYIRHNPDLYAIAVEALENRSLSPAKPGSIRAGGSALWRSIGAHPLTGRKQRIYGRDGRNHLKRLTKVGHRFIAVVVARRSANRVRKRALR